MKRNLSFDFIRCVAIVFVICIHSMALIDGMVNLSIFPRLVKTVLDTFIYSGVPLFIMLSGSLLLTKEESLSVFFIKRIRRILLPFFLWSMLVYAILYVQEGGRNPMEWFTFFIYKYVNDQLGHSGKEDTPMDFHQTRGGQQFLYGTMPKLVKEIAEEVWG